MFAGQGSQKVGMGLELASACADCHMTIHIADEVLCRPLTTLMTWGPEDELSYTMNAQPAILCLSVAHARHLKNEGIQPDILAGHSLGLYSALVISGALDYDIALRLVSERGRLMQEAVPLGRGAMMAIVGLDRDLVYDAVRRARAVGVVNVAGHNSPGQTVISGEVAAVDHAAELCEEEGGGAVPLKVSAPFHSDLMAPMLPEFSRLVDRTPFSDLEIPVIDDVTGKPFPNSTAIRDSLVKQITSPILFEEGTRFMVAGGVNRFIQCGPGMSLLNFAQRVSPAAEQCTFDEAARVRARLL